MHTHHSKSFYAATIIPHTRSKTLYVIPYAPNLLQTYSNHLPASVFPATTQAWRPLEFVILELKAWTSNSIAYLLDYKLKRQADLQQYF